MTVPDAFRDTASPCSPSRPTMPAPPPPMVSGRRQLPAINSLLLPGTWEDRWSGVVFGEDEPDELGA